MQNRRIALLLFLLCMSCAHQMTPSGGPDDRAGPTIMSVTPAPGSLRVDRHSTIAITFSEWIAKPTALKSVSILPPIEKGFKIRVSRRTLEIIPSTAYADSTTYHLVITTALQDLHGNPLAAPYALVFSTGACLDSGKIVGCVVDPVSGRKEPPTVALYHGTSGPESDTSLFRNPDYLTQADSAGFFSFEHLHRGTYRLVAFIDQNGNRRLDPGTEAAYAPLRSTIAISNQPDTLMLFPAAGDTATPRLESVRPASANLIICKWTGRLDTLRGYGEPAWTIVRFTDKKQTPAVAETYWMSGRGSCALRLSDTLSRVPYLFLYSLKKKQGLSFVTVSDTVRFNGVSGRDTVRPALQSTSPTGTIPLLPEFRLVFSKPVKLTAPLALIDSLRDTVTLKGSAEFTDTVKLTLPRRLRPENRYRLRLLCASGEDMSGNPLKPRDSTDTVAVLAVSTIAVDSIAISLKGCASCLSADPKRKWQFLPFSGSAPQPARDSAGCFRFDSLASGKGFIGYFTDENGNDVPDQGNLVPFRAPEPYHVLRDTIEARARWEIEGVSVPACSGCKPHAPAPAVPAVKK
jgi:uncharacterized protein (DUF2141 family)